MTCKLGMCLLGLVLTAVAVDAAEQQPVGSQRIDGVLFLNCRDVAAALNLEFKVAQADRLVTFCQKGDESFCIPVRLSAGKYRSQGGNTLIDADSLSKALRLKVIADGDRIAIEPRSDTSSSREPAAPAYNAAWGSGRGFREGQTLPDIPLVDLKGNEVRFSQFLGKRYILYCWASW